MAVDQIVAEGTDGDRGGKVVDEEKYSHGRRLQAIHDAHTRVMKVRNAVEERLITNRISEHQGRRYYRSAVESLILEMLPVLEADDIGLQKDYVNEADLGVITIQPPSDFVDFARANIDRIPEGGGVPQPAYYPIVGLRTVLEAPSPIAHEFSFAIQHGRDDTEVYRRQVTTELDRHLLDTAVQYCTRALEDADMGLNIESLDREAEFTYEDLLGGDD